MRGGNNIYVQHHKTKMINEEWNKTQNDAPFVTFYNMRAVKHVKTRALFTNNSLECSLSYSLDFSIFKSI